ncbi:unnamed protein product, partial [Mesorhabditis spiculigera]
MHTTQPRQTVLPMTGKDDETREEDMVAPVYCAVTSWCLLGGALGAIICTPASVCCYFGCRDLNRDPFSGRGWALAIAGGITGLIIVALYFLVRMYIDDPHMFGDSWTQQQYGSWTDENGTTHTTMEEWHWKGHSLEGFNMTLLN